MGGVGGSSPLYKLFSYVRPQRVWFWSRFGLEKGIDFNHILVWILVTRSENGRMNFGGQVWSRIQKNNKGSGSLENRAAHKGVPTPPRGMLIQKIPDHHVHFARLIKTHEYWTFMRFMCVVWKLCILFLHVSKHKLSFVLILKIKKVKFEMGKRGQNFKLSYH